MKNIRNCISHWLDNFSGHLCAVVEVSFSISLHVCCWQNFKREKPFFCGLACRPQRWESKQETENLHVLTRSPKLLLKVIRCCWREIYRNNKFFHFPWNGLTNQHSQCFCQPGHLASIVTDKRIKGGVTITRQTLEFKTASFNLTTPTNKKCIHKLEWLI